MSYNVIVPSAGASPGVFPGQNNANFQRLLDIINAEHNFTTGSSDTQGIHRRVTLISYPTGQPPSVTVGNGILYTIADVNNIAQLHWLSNGGDVQLTPGIQYFTGVTSVASNATETIFADPGYSYQAYVWAAIQSGSTGVLAVAVRQLTGGNYVLTTFPNNTLTLTYVSNNLSVTNSSNITRSINWTVEILKI